jgi:multicomponent Na+:H+ antiporter subunit B
MSRSFILSRTARILLPVLVVLSLVTFYRGHHLPGGGFIGGLLAASGFALVALGDGTAAARRLLRIKPVSLMAGGLSVALGSGILGLVAGGALFRGLWLPEIHIPVLGVVHLGTPMLFDAGVYLTVAGFALQVLFSLQEADA